ncbi:uncharacterized protein TRAVEDRAFT_103266, partial [Trametes versicolor FP-101664 SS1]|uniref:uncharacterized protein n=1 Tax=Trametes versicolor (strain FP-101664) TaxID=717944 RepID=UPI0004622737
LARLRKCWNSPLYAFFKTDVEIEYVGGRRSHVFTCARKDCGFTTRCYLDTKDRLTGNLSKHAIGCWGEEVVARAKETASDEEARRLIVDSIEKSGHISAYFSRNKKGKVTYSHMQHTREETSIVHDPGFLSLMKTGRPGYYVPSPSTVSQDVKMVFARTRERIAQLLQDYEGKLSFGTDAWTSPNHRAFVVITVHLEVDGQPLRLLLDLVEVAESHTGFNLAAAF